AGIIDPGESPMEAAARELAEETGLTSGKLFPILSAYVSPGGSSAFAHHFLAEVSLEGFAGGYGGVANEHEDIRVLSMSLSDALEQVQHGLIRSQHTIIGLYHLGLQIAQVR